MNSLRTIRSGNMAYGRNNVKVFRRTLPQDREQSPTSRLECLAICISSGGGSFTRHGAPRQKPHIMGYTTMFCMRRSRR